MNEKDFLKTKIISEKFGKILDNIQKNSDKPIFDDIIKIYEDMIKVASPSKEGINKYPLVKIPLTNINVGEKVVTYDIVCPGISKDQIELSVEQIDPRTFLSISGKAWMKYNISENNPVQSQIEIGDILIKYDITPYNIELGEITSEHKDGILTVFLPKKAEKKNLKINIL